MTDAANMQEIIQKDKKNVWHHLTPHRGMADPMVIVKGEGMKLTDAKGKEFLDFSSGSVWCVNVGYGRVEIADKVRDSLVDMCYYAQHAGNVPAAQFAERLVEKMPGMSRVFFANSGSEANEKAFKLVRQLAAKKYGGKKSKILYRERDYHGTSLGCLSATGQIERREQFGPFLDGFVEVPHCLEYRSQWGDVVDYGTRAANEIERVILEEGADTVGAICLEPITAGGGCIVPPAGYWKRVQEICTQYKVLLILDEVVFGMGRSGAWFGYQQFDIKPDIVTMAKGLASAYSAISCMVTTEEVFEMANSDDGCPKMDYFRDVSTFAGCTAGPTAALANLEIIERENLLENVNAMGDYLKTALFAMKEKYPVVGDVRGMGLFWGMELVKDRVSKEPAGEGVAIGVVGHCAANGGVLIGRTNRCFGLYNNTIFFCPAFICTPADIDAACTALDAALAAIKL